MLVVHMIVVSSVYNGLSFGEKLLNFNECKDVGTMYMYIHVCAA